MAVFYSDSFSDNDELRAHVFGDLAQVRDCFLCGEALTYPMVAWHGAQGLICFHDSCATSFVLRFARDCWELEKMQGVSREAG